MGAGKTDPNIELVKRQFAEGEIDRREFLCYATLTGLAAAAAYAFFGTIDRTGAVPSAHARSLPKPEPCASAIG
jgi:hypothetical protein